MGGYGATAGRKKGSHYLDSGGHKVRDKNAVAIGEYYINRGKYVVFLQEKPSQLRADLSVDGVHIEVKGMDSVKANTISKQIGHAFDQVNGDNFRYDPETHREGKVILLSKHKSIKTAYRAFYAGYRDAVKKGLVKGKVEMWFPKGHGDYVIYKFN